MASVLPEEALFTLTECGVTMEAKEEAPEPEYSGLPTTTGPACSITTAQLCPPSQSETTQQPLEARFSLGGCRISCPVMQPPLLGTRDAPRALATWPCNSDKPECQAAPTTRCSGTMSAARI